MICREVDFAANAAAAAFREFSQRPGADRARGLRAIADGIEKLGDSLLETVQRESALPLARLSGERTRTCTQLRQFADLAQQDTWRDTRVDAADPARTPPRPEVRSQLVPLGPAAVFAASNFPLAFSVAGGDTASALAVGCPVVLRAHPAHPETSQRVAAVIRDALAATGLPDGAFALLSGGGREIGIDLVAHPAIKVGAFTGSLQGGMALWRTAQQRREPIPFFAEMGSVNPVFVHGDALARDAQGLAQGLHASLTLGVGQFCTQPGLVFLADDAAGRAFAARLAELVAATAPGEMLSETIGASYRSGVAARGATRGVATLAAAAQNTGSARSGSAALFATDAATWLACPELSEELFGPSSLIVWCASARDFPACAAALHGQLTATVWGDAPDPDLLWALEQKAGRIVFNGFPTGVELGGAMMHGGPFPATTDSRFTSVGLRAFQRFVRPLAWQTPAGAAGVRN